jgi:hypothetical protein
VEVTFVVVELPINHHEAASVAEVAGAVHRVVGEPLMLALSRSVPVLATSIPGMRAKVDHHSRVMAKRGYEEVVEEHRPCAGYS